MSRLRNLPLRLTVHLAAAGLLVWLLVDFYTGGLAVVHHLKPKRAG